MRNMKKTCLFVRFLGLIILLSFILSAMSSCAGEEAPPVTVEFQDVYLPTCNLSLSEFYVGMSTKDFHKKIENLEVNVDYVYYGDFYFLRTSDKKSVVIELSNNPEFKIRALHVFDDRTTLATKEDCSQLKEGMTVPQIVEKIGMPNFTQLYLSVRMPLVFPLADGSLCQIYLHVNEPKLFLVEYA